MPDLPIKSKFLIFVHLPKDNEVIIYNKKSKEQLAVIWQTSKKSWWWTPEKGISFDRTPVFSSISGLTGGS